MLLELRLYIGEVTYWFHTYFTGFWRVFKEQLLETRAFIFGAESGLLEALPEALEETIPFSSLAAGR